MYRQKLSAGPNISFSLFFSSQLPGQELGPSQTEAPVLARVGGDADDQVGAGHAALLVEALGQGGVHGLLLGGVAALLEDLDEDELVGAREAEVGVLADHLVGLVLGDDLDMNVELRSKFEGTMERAIGGVVPGSGRAGERRTSPA